MRNQIIALPVFKGLFRPSYTHYKQPIFVYFQIILAVFKEGTEAITFPELLTFMAVQNSLILVITDVQEHNVVSIDVNDLVTDNYLLKSLFWVVHYIDVAIRDVELILPSDQELTLGWVCIAELKNENAKSPFKSVGKYQVGVVNIVVEQGLHISQLQALCNSCQLLQFKVDVEDIIICLKHQYILTFIWNNLFNC